MTMQMSVTALASFAAEVRPDWDASAITGAILAAQRAGWSWKRILSEVSRMIADDEDDPRSLLDAARLPLDGGTRVDSVTYERGAAAARAALEAVLPVREES